LVPSIIHVPNFFRESPPVRSYAPRAKVSENFQPFKNFFWPKSAVFDTFTVVHSLYTQIVGAVDGKISLEALAQALGPRYGLSVEDAVQSFGRFLMKVYESG
jgi:hypothetical protein